MSYAGNSISYPIGRSGLLTDANAYDIPPQNLLQALNIELKNSVIQKDYGSRRWNDIALSGSIHAAFDWWPNDIQQFLIAACADNKIYRYENPESVVEVTGPALTINHNQVCILPCGAESQGRAKKLLIMTGNNQVQVISGTNTTRTNIATPAADWTTSFPRFGLLHRSRPVLFGNDSDPHRIYLGDPDNHEIFTGANFLQFSVFPGEGERLISGAIYRGRLLLFKYPRGVYYLVDDDPDPANWFVKKLTDEFGIASAYAIARVQDDLVAKNSTGSVSAFSGIQEFGDIESADILNALRVENYFITRTSSQGTPLTHMLYHEARKTSYLTYQSSGGSGNDFMLKADLQNDPPAIMAVDKDDPNILFLRRVEGQLKPFYGHTDGFIYEMLREDREIVLLDRPLHGPAATDAGAGAMSAGTYVYKVTFYNHTTGLETDAGYPSNAVTIAGSRQIALTEVPIDVRGIATQRRIYRNFVGTTIFYRHGTITDNTTTTYADNSDSFAATVSPPAYNGFSTAYTSRFQTAHTDFKFADPALDKKTKIFDFIEVGFYPTGDWNISLSYYIDGKFQETLTFPLTWGNRLNDNFATDDAILAGEVPRSIRKRIRGMGRTISFVVENAQQKRNFKIAALRVYFRPGNEKQKERES